MGIVEIIMTGVGLSMDAFAISICKGMKVKHISFWQALVIGLFFGGFQFLMPVIGYYISSTFASYISSYGHWIAFALLLFIGIKMIVETVKGTGEDTKDTLRIGELFLLAIATSIDALAVGVSLAFDDVNIWFASGVIGIVTLIISMIGVAIGKFSGGFLKNKAGILGGCILILIGIKILLSGLNIIDF